MHQDGSTSDPENVSPVQHLTPDDNNNEKTKRDTMFSNLSGSNQKDGWERAPSVDDKIAPQVSEGLGQTAIVGTDEADANREAATETEAAPVYKVYKRRWFGLAQLTLLNIVVSWDVSWASTSFQFPISLARCILPCRWRRRARSASIRGPR